MKNTFLLPTFVILLAWLVSADSAAAQRHSFVEIRNQSALKKKVCMYPFNAIARTSPYKCFVIDPHQKVVWDRQGKRSGFLVKVFVSGRVLHARRAYERYNLVLISSHGIRPVYVRPKGTQP
jgi:hypothetical protein